MYECVPECACVWICTWRLEVDAGTLNPSQITLLLRYGVLLNLELTGSFQVADWQVPEVLLFLLSRVEF